MNNISKVISSFGDESRFYVISTKKSVWFYDCHSQSMFSFERKIYEELVNLKNEEFSSYIAKKSLAESAYILGILNNIKKFEEDKTSFLTPTNKINIMINTSNRCNLNCSYCYRNKNDAGINTIENVRKTIDWVMKDYKPKLSEYNFTYSMRSESSLDVKLLNQIKDDYVKYEPQEFTEFDLFDDNSDEFLKVLYQDFASTDFIFENEIENNSKKSVVKILNSLLSVRNLYEILRMSDGMFSDSVIKEIKRRNDYSDWKAFCSNRYILEVKYSKFIDVSKKKEPAYPSFSFFSNGTCANAEFIKLIKEIGMDEINISIDGPKEVHDFNRKYNNGNGSYDVIVKNLEILKSSGVRIKASAVLTSYYPYPLKVALHLKSLGFSEVTMTPVRPGSEFSFTEENVDELLKGYDEFFERLKRDVLKGDFSLLQFIQSDYSLNALGLFLSRTKQVRRCDVDNQLVINAKGDIYNCLYFEAKEEKKLGNILTGITNKEFEIDKSVANRNLCKKCWARYLCGGTCFYSSLKINGDILGAESIECKIRKHLVLLCLNFVIFCKENEVNEF